MQYKILHSILKSCVDTCCFFFPCRVDRAKGDIKQNKHRGRKQYLYHAYVLSRLNIFLLYLFGLIVLAFEYGRGVLKSLKLVKVGPSLALDDSQ